MNDNDKQIIASIDVDDTVKKYQNGESIKDVITKIMEIEDHKTRVDFFQDFKTRLGF